MLKPKQASVQNLNSDRPRSLNPLIYPTWWGDDEATGSSEPPLDRKARDRSTKNTFKLAATQAEQYIPASNMF